MVMNHQGNVPLSTMSTATEQAPMETAAAPQEALVVEMSYEEFMDLSCQLSSLAYEMEDLQKVIEELKKPVEGESDEDVANRKSLLERSEVDLKEMEAQYDLISAKMDQAEVANDSEDFCDDEGGQFDFGESAADW
jgi:hypothetical protein